MESLTDEALHGVSLLGKRKPGFRWACPCFGPGGWDVGRHMWDSWNRRCDKSGKVVEFLLANPDGRVHEKGEA